MRFKYIFSENTKPVPVSNQALINSYFHKTLGENNEYHDSSSFYCLTNLRGAKKILNNKTHNNYPNGCWFYLTTLDYELLNQFNNKIQSNKEIGYGMILEKIEYVDENIKLDSKYLIFRTLTPIHLKDYKNHETNVKPKQFTIDDPEYIDVLKSRTINRLKKINPDLNFNGFNMIIKNHPNNKKIKHYVKNIPNLATQTDVIIYANDSRIYDYIYNCGLGMSTGSGFGTVFISENIKKYEMCFK